MSLKNRFREWLSDNLRYFMLGFGILAVVAVIFFGVRWVSSALEDESTKVDNGGKDAVVTSSSKYEVDKDTDEADTDEEDKNPEDKDETSDDTESQSTSEDEAAVTADVTKELEELMNRYYQALGSKDVDTLKQVVDVLSETDQAEIVAEANIQEYRDVETYVYPGPQEDTYIVLAGFLCKYKEIDTLAPGLQQMYIYRNAEGNLVIQAAVEDAEVQRTMKETLELTDVATLIADTQAAYKEARESDAKLDALITSVAGS